MTIERKPLPSWLRLLMKPARYLGRATKPTGPVRPCRGAARAKRRRDHRRAFRSEWVAIRRRLRGEGA